MNPILAESRRHLADLIEACQRLHYCELSGERSDTFLRVLAVCEKAGIVPAAEDWQTCRSLRNRAAHDYGTDFEVTASHFNALRGQIPLLTTVTLALTDQAERTLGIQPPDARFSAALRQAGRGKPE